MNFRQIQQNSEQVETHKQQAISEVDKGSHLTWDNLWLNFLLFCHIFVVKIYMTNNGAKQIKVIFYLEIIE